MAVNRIIYYFGYILNLSNVLLFFFLKDAEQDGVALLRDRLQVIKIVIFFKKKYAVSNEINIKY